MRVLLDLTGTSHVARRLRFVAHVLRGMWTRRIHPSVRLGRNVSITGAGEVCLGAHCSLRSDVAISVAHGALLRLGTGVEVGYGVRISVPAGRRMVIGNYVRLNSGCVLSGEIDLGDHCVLAAQASLVSDSHNFTDPRLTVDENDRRYGMKLHRIEIGEGAFIGTRALVFGPAVVGARSIVGAGVMMSDTLPPEHVLKVSRSALVQRPRRPGPDVNLGSPPQSWPSS